MELVVKNLNRRIEVEELKKLFTPLGKVKSVKIVRDYDAGLNKVQGLVEMASSEDAFRAIKELNETTFGTRLIYVSKSHSKF